MSHTLHYASPRPEVWKAYWRAWARPTGLWIHHVFIGLVAAILSLVSLRHFDLKSLLLMWVLATLICLVLLPLWPQLRFKSAVRSLTVDASGFQTTIGKLSASRVWSQIDRIDDTGQEILIVGKNGNAMIVPQRAFRDTQERAAFLRDARSWHRGADA